MKGIGKIHISRKLVLAFGGVLVLCGTTGATAVYIGADKILGPSYAQLNGLACTEVKTVTVKKKDRFWVRKYITTAETEDGLARVRTALRVASVIHDEMKPDLIQVVVLDTKGPKTVPDMRGRAVGADVLFISDPSRVPEHAGGQMFTARYIDKPANEIGQFYGEKINLTEDDIGQLVSLLDDRTDCVKPEVATPDGHGAASDGHGEAKPAEGHGEAKEEGTSLGHGEASGHGEAAPAEGHGAEASAEGHGEAAPKGTEATNKGWFASIKGMILGGDKEEAAAPGSEDHAAAPAAEGEAGHGEPVTEQAATEEDAGHGEAKPVAAEMPHDTTAGKQASAHGAEVSAPGHEVAAAPVAAEATKGWLGSVAGMIFGEKEVKPLPFGGAGQKIVPAEQASVPAAPAEEDGPHGEQAGEQAHAPAAKSEEAKKAEAPVTDHGGGEMSTEADAAGAAWLAKMRAPVKAATAPAEHEPSADAAKAHDEQPAAVIPAEDSLVLPPKASDSKDAEQQAEASH